MATDDPAAASGFALLRQGFRPFFLMAALFAAGIIPVWMAVWSGHIVIAGPFSPLDWHIHELLFGYASAVIAGFLFTAVPNWTGRMPTRGWPLAALAALWIAGRLAVAGLLPLGPVAVLVLDCAFLAAIGAMVLTEIVAGRNWANLRVVVPVLVYLLANVTFHVEALSSGQAGMGRRLGFAMVVMLILLIGGRIIPSFTRNWLAKRGRELARDPGPLPAPFGRLDKASLAVSLGALLPWVVWPENRIVAAGLLLAGIGQSLRLGRWRGWRTLASPLLLMLHLAFAFIPGGVMALGLAGFGLLQPAAGFHLLGIGGIGGMTLAVMMRASLGHTGRPLEVGPALALAFASVALAAALRSAATSEAAFWVAAALWSFGFTLFLTHYAPILATANAGRRRPNHKAD